jgi:HAD superfamily hydrolase (TIGR01509 family)
VSSSGWVGFKNWKMIKALIFDFDGLILDTESPEFQAWQEVFAAHGHELAPELWADLIGRPRTYFDMYAYFKALNGPLTDLDALRKDRRARVIQSVLEQPILPGVLNYLSEAKEMGLKIGLASSSGGEYVRGHLKRLNLFEYFHVTKCLEDTEAHKPDPAPYLAVLDEIGVSPREAIAFEDSPNGVAAARAAGLFCIAVPNPITQCLSLSHADHCLKSLADEPLRQLLSRAADRNGRSV